MSARSVQIIGRDDNSPPFVESDRIVAQVDWINGGLVQMDEVHAQIHRGRFFTSTIFDTAVADDASLEVLVITPADGGMHFRPVATGGGDAEADVFEGTVVSANGTAASFFNRNRLSSSVSAMQIFTGPTITADGAQLINSFLPGGTGFFATPGATQSYKEIILAQSTNYLIRVTNRAGTIQPISLVIDWYDTAL